MNKYWLIINKKDSKPIAKISPQGVKLSNKFRIEESQTIGHTPNGRRIDLDMSNLINSSNSLVRLLRLALREDNS